MTNLYVIRHGEATTQVGEMLRDDGLTPKGVAQAERLRDRLAASGEIQADVLIASTLPRATQTAEIIAPALGVPILFDDDLQELRIGEAEGLSVAEFREKYGGYRIDEEPFRPVAPGGENWGQFMLRVGTTLERILQQYEGKTIVLVCHGGIVDGSFIYFFGMQSFMLPETRFDTHNTSITQWRKRDTFGRTPRWRLVRYNDDLHVRDLNAPERIPWQHLPVPKRVSSARPAPSDTPTVAPTEQ